MSHKFNIKRRNNEAMVIVLIFVPVHLDYMSCKATSYPLFQRCAWIN